jgi:hypothetical protein
MVFTLPLVSSSPCFAFPVAWFPWNRVSQEEQNKITASFRREVQSRGHRLSQSAGSNVLGGFPLEVPVVVPVYSMYDCMFVLVVQRSVKLHFSH